MASIDLKPLRVAIYARFSSDRQREASIDDQIRRCREYVERHGGRVEPDLVFTDAAMSGASLVRPGFEAMMGLTRTKPRGVDAIVTEDISRISRDFADAAMIFKLLQYQGVSLVGVADGINTSEKSAKLTFTVKSLVADLYLDDLRDKTLRGLEGRALAGYSTGGLPYGYRSTAVPGPDAKQPIGFKVSIDEEAAAVVRRIFNDYRSGRSLSGIAIDLNKEAVRAPRANSRHRRKGWVASTIRVILRNEKYIGEWRFKERRWVKVPGTNKRRPQMRDPSEVVRQMHPERRIIDEVLWTDVRNRLDVVFKHYTRDKDGNVKGRAAAGLPSRFLFSGLLTCDACGAPMVIYGGGSSRYYRCSDSMKRGTCPNRLGVKEEIARKRILETVHDLLASPEAISFVRQRIAEVLGELDRTVGTELIDRRKRLERTEARLQGLIGFIADGDRSEYVTTALRDLEVQAKTERAQLREIEHQATAPIQLPSITEIEKRAFEFEKRLRENVTDGREALRQLFKDGEVRLRREGATFVARGEVYPLVLLKETAASASAEAAVYVRGSGGRI